MGQLDSTRAAPTLVLRGFRRCKQMSGFGTAAERHKSLRLKAKGLKPGYHITGSRVGSGSGHQPGYHITGSRVGSQGAFQALGGLDSTCTRPTMVPLASRPRVTRTVQVQVEFARHNLKPGDQFIGSRVETKRLQAMGQVDSTCTAPPHFRPVVQVLHPDAHRRARDVAAQVCI
jgi:hypothetical protein